MMTEGSKLSLLDWLSRLLKETEELAEGRLFTKINITQLTSIDIAELDILIVSTKTS